MGSTMRIEFHCWAMAVACVLVLLAVGSAATVRAADLEQSIEFNIPSQSLDVALVQFSQQAKVQITSAAAQLAGLTSEAIVGRYRIIDALSKLLQRSGLSYRAIGDSAISIGKFSPGSAMPPRASAAAPSQLQATLTQTGAQSDGASTSPRSQETNGVVQADAATQLGEIVIRARKRAENVQDIPISVTDFSATDLENYRFINVEDIGFAIPNFTWGRLTTISEIICIRGICSDSSAPGFDTGIAVILDDVYIGRAAGFATSLLDIDHIDVLRGPQGTLQGRNATGGTISISTSRPSNEFTGMADVSYGNYNQVIAQGVLSGPIVNDLLSGKIAVSRHSHDGFEENAQIDKPLDTEDSYAIRGQLRLTPTKDLEALLTGDFDHFNNHDFHNANGPPVTDGPPPQFFTRVVNGNIQNYGSREVFGGAFNVYWTLPNNLSLVSVSSYRGFRVVDVQNGSQDASGFQAFGPAGAGLPLATAREDQNESQFSEELRIGSPTQKGFSWLAGVYYYWEKLHDYQNFLAGFNDGTVLEGSAAIDDATMFTNSIAGFGSATWDLDPFWSVTAGARDTRNSRHITMVEELGIDGTGTSGGVPFTYVNMPTVQNPVPETFQAATIYPTDHNSLTDEAWTGDFTVTQHWLPDISTYARYAHGFKGGGFNANFNNGFGAGVVKPEFIDSLEAGVRSELLDHRLRVNATVFYLKQRDQQILVYDTSLNLYVTSNAPKTTSYGGELDISSKISRDLTATLGLGITDAHFHSGPYDGNLVPYTSFASVTGTLQYTRPLTAGTEFFAFTDVSWKDGYYTSPDDQPDSHQKSYVWADGRLGIQAPGGRWSVGLYDRNAFNTNVLAFGLYAGSFTVGFIQEPRTYGVDARVKF